ncbi:hypothetical protein HYH03_014473 [Edaphochlamys debaryana]|uniref:Limiting CO2-inducible protein B/C beta carbonyic anhydrase domain-containing protein n=1 Tax=Edaphochlamys debaryana TaxID=47281 RepID=A0A836BTI7_9CHLO|nr:hypothetical protein HYH03_014473 [Edaphochlamys debaryana]|eukprot:KAG2486879.1 hypothetical protein HYH03_014473 [Edaphochlamys debaryana]
MFALGQRSTVSCKAACACAGCRLSGRVTPVPVSARMSSVARPSSKRSSAAVSVRAQAASTAVAVAAPAAVEAAPARRTFAARHQEIIRSFPSAMGVDDFMGRVEVSLAGFGFTGDNSIAMTNLCRDEVTQVLKDKIEAIFGSSFNTNGLGGVLTCGVTGMKAGLSHSPVCNGGRERYVFFAFPHIAINSEGEMGALSRPGRPKQSCACGALLAILNAFKVDGVEKSCKVPGVHDPLDPELTILQQRLARRVRYEKLNVQQLDLPALTQVAERTITDDLEYLIEKAVDPATSDYAVITGVQIHNWGKELTEDGDSSIEFVAPAKCYAVVNGLKTYIDLPQVPALSPRQIMTMSTRSFNGTAPKHIQPGMRGSVISEVPLQYLVGKLGGSQLMTDGTSYAPNFSSTDSFEWPTWQSRIRLDNNPNRLLSVERDTNAPTMDSPEPETVHTSFQAPQ